MMKLDTKINSLANNVRVFHEKSMGQFHDIQGRLDVEHDFNVQRFQTLEDKIVSLTGIIEKVFVDLGQSTQEGMKAQIDKMQELGQEISKTHEVTKSHMQELVKSETRALSVPLASFLAEKAKKKVAVSTPRRLPPLDRAPLPMPIEPPVDLRSPHADDTICSEADADVDEEEERSSLRTIMSLLGNVGDEDPGAVFSEDAMVGGKDRASASGLNETSPATLSEKDLEFVVSALEIHSKNVTLQVKCSLSLSFSLCMCVTRFHLE
jgi:hypothetical protein